MKKLHILLILTIVLILTFSMVSYTHKDPFRIKIHEFIRKIRTGDRIIFRLVVLDTFLFIHDRTNNFKPRKSSFRRRTHLFGWSSLPAYLGGLRNQDPRVRYLYMKYIFKYINPMKAQSFQYKTAFQMRDLDFKGLPLRDEELEQVVRDYKQLNHLDLQGTTITDKSLLHLGKLKDLKSLNLSGTGITGKELSQLKNVEHLDLSYSQITNFNEISQLTQLKSLNLEGTSFFDYIDRNYKGGDPFEQDDSPPIRKYNKELLLLKPLKNLKKLSLAESWLDNEGLKDLKILNNIEILDISNTEITDKGIKHLSQLNNLKELYIYSYSISKKTLETLKTALPHCKIYSKITEG